MGKIVENLARTQLAGRSLQKLINNYLGIIKYILTFLKLK